MLIKDIESEKKHYSQIWTSFCGADLICSFDNQVIGEIQSYSYKSGDENEAILKNYKSKGILNVELVLFSGSLPIIKSLKIKNKKYNFTAKYCNEYGDMMIIDFPVVSYNSFFIRSSIDNVVSKVILKYEVLDEPNIFEYHNGFTNVTGIECNPLITKQNSNTCLNEYEDNGYKLNIYVPKISCEKDLYINIDDYINDNNLYKTAYYKKLDYKKMHTDSIIYRQYPCTVHKGSAIIFKGLCEELIDAADRMKKDNRKKGIDENKLACDMNICATFDLDSEIKESFDKEKEKEQGKVLVEAIRFDINGQEAEFKFNENECGIAEDKNYNEAYINLYGYNIECFNFNDTSFHTAKYLANAYAIKEIRLKSNCLNKIKNFKIERIMFRDGYNNKFDVNKRVIEEYNKTIDEELIINDTDN